jgi:hypothetical protein
MGSSEELQQLLESVIPEGKVYAQPPSFMTYPCIKFKRDSASTQFADNLPYSFVQRYELTLIADDPDSPVVKRLAALPMCSFNRNYVFDQLTHDVFFMYF